MYLTLKFGSFVTKTIGLFSPQKLLLIQLKNFSRYSDNF